MGFQSIASFISPPISGHGTGAIFCLVFTVAFPFLELQIHVEIESGFT